MPADRTSLDEFLAFQAQPRPLKATVEAVDGDPLSVTITPWIPGFGCLCSNSLKIPRSAIDFVVATDDTHRCCGKELRVVELGFAKDQHMALDDVFAQLISKAGKKGSSMPTAAPPYSLRSQPPPRNQPPPRGIPNHQSRMPVYYQREMRSGKRRAGPTGMRPVFRSPTSDAMRPNDNLGEWYALCLSDCDINCMGDYYCDCPCEYNCTQVVCWENDDSWCPPFNCP